MFEDIRFFVETLEIWSPSMLLRFASVLSSYRLLKALLERKFRSVFVHFVTGVLRESRRAIRNGDSRPSKAA